MTRRIATAAALAIVALAAMTGPPARAREAAVAYRASTVRLYGQVGAVTVTAGNPTAFVLQTPRRSYFLHIAPYATFTALSAEAEVEGLVADDFAAVLAKHVRHSWVAVRIIFDVQPLQAAPVTTIATVVRYATDGSFVVIRLPSGNQRRVLITTHTRFQIDGQVVAAPFALNPGDSVQMTMRLQDKGWVALDINLQHTPVPAG
jgi:hypothetical protein